MSSTLLQEQEKMDKLLLKAENDDSKLYELAMTYVYLMASSDISLIELYQPKVFNVINKWRGSLKTADAIYYLVNGYRLFFLTKPQEGLVELNKMFDYCDDTDLFRGIKGAAFVGLGVCNRGLGHFDKTMENCLTGLKYIKTEDPEELWHVYIFRMLGEIHTYIGELDEAVHYYLKAKSVMEKAPNKLFISTAFFRVYDALGNCYHEMGESDKAAKYLRAAMEVGGLSDAEQARVSCDFGILYLNEPKKALRYFEQSCDLRKMAKLEDAYTTSLIYKGECLIKIGDLSKAEDVLKEAGPLVAKYNVPSKRLHLYQQFAALNERKGNYEEANKQFHLYDDLKNQIHVKQNKNIFHIKNKLIADQHQEIEKKHGELKETLSELARIKVSRKALFFSIATLVVLVILTEVFLEPMIEEYSMNQYLSIGAKIFIAFLLKPIDTIYERLLFQRAYKA